ncbi:MAG: acetyl-CoA carboxylase biotin carboxyl carrier protein [Balneolaceae bacterium]
MDLKLIKNLLTLISESDVNEVSIEEGEFKIKVKKQPESASSSVQYIPQQSVQQPVQKAQEPPAQPEKTEKKKPESSKADGETVKSPIVGTFYRSPSPEDEPFVKVGDSVEKGQVLCIIEAMKIMNEIESEFSGTVQDILAEDAQPVEYDQPLFIIKKD